MRYFQRQPLESAIQNQLSIKTSKNWKSLTEYQRDDIVTKLIASQKHTCAYCECKITSEEGFHHIEHFKERHDYSDLIFSYANMLLSCQGNITVSKQNETTEEAEIRKNNMSCGHRKERGRHGSEINYNLLLNPTNEGVSALFSYFDGVIDSRNSCTEIQKKQVGYTVNRLKLDAKRLENSRISEIDLVQKGLEGLTENDQKNYIRSLLDESQTVLNPYFSTIKDNFGFMLL